MTRKTRTLVSAVALSFAFHAASADSLEPTLAKLSRVAELYRDSALGFACQESIHYTGPAPGHIQFAYIFIKDEDGRLRDFRAWRSGTTAKERGQEVDPRDYRVPRFLASAYLWAFVFRADRQPLYRFERSGDAAVADRQAMTIKFVPRTPIRKGLNDWAGYAWIDPDTSQILRVEAYTPTNWNLKVLREAKRSDRSYDIERIITDFGFAKNGMRFPSHVEITTTRSTYVAGTTGDVLRDTTLLRVTQDYSRFEFFSVRTREEIARFVIGAQPLVNPDAAPR